MPARVTYKLEELATGRPFRVVGTGLTRLAALGEANTKLNMTVGTVTGNSVSEELTGAEAGDPSEDTQFSDAVIVLQHSVSGVKRAIKLDNVTTAIGTGLSGQVDVDNALVTAFAAAYRDGDGGGGYEAYDGYFVA